MSDSGRDPGRLDERFADWVDERLDAEARRQLETELAEDPELAAAAAEYRRTVETLREHLEDGDIEPPAELVTGVMAAVRQERGPGRRWMPFLASLSAAAALVLTVVWLNLPVDEPRREPVADRRMEPSLDEEEREVKDTRMGDPARNRKDDKGVLGRVQAEGIPPRDAQQAQEPQDAKDAKNARNKQARDKQARNKVDLPRPDPTLDEVQEQLKQGDVFRREQLFRREQQGAGKAPSKELPTPGKAPDPSASGGEKPVAKVAPGAQKDRAPEARGEGGGPGRGGAGHSQGQGQGRGGRARRRADSDDYKAPATAGRTDALGDLGLLAREHLQRQTRTRDQGPSPAARPSPEAAQDKASVPAPSAPAVPVENNPARAGGKAADEEARRAWQGRATQPVGTGLPVLVVAVAEPPVAKTDSAEQKAVQPRKAVKKVAEKAEKTAEPTQGPGAVLRQQQELANNALQGATVLHLSGLPGERDRKAPPARQPAGSDEAGKLQDAKKMAASRPGAAAPAPAFVPQAGDDVFVVIGTRQQVADLFRQLRAGIPDQPFQLQLQQVQPELQRFLDRQPGNEQAQVAGRRTNTGQRPADLDADTTGDLMRFLLVLRPAAKQR